MTYKYSFTKLCSQDLDEALQYICETLCNKAAAQKLNNTFLETVNTITAFPYSFPDCNIYLIEDKNIRHALINNFVLIYYIDDVNKEIFLLRFQFSGRSIADINIVGA